MTRPLDVIREAFRPVDSDKFDFSYEVDAEAEMRRRLRRSVYSTAIGAGATVAGPFISYAGSNNGSTLEAIGGGALMAAGLLLAIYSAKRFAAVMGRETGNEMLTNFGEGK